MSSPHGSHFTYIGLFVLDTFFCTICQFHLSNDFLYYSEISFRKLTISKKKKIKEDVMSSCAGVNCQETCEHVGVGDDALC